MAKNKAARYLLLTGWGIILSLGTVLTWFWKTLPPQLPWFYSLPGGEQQLVSKMVLAYVLAGMAVVLGLTRLVARWASKGDIPVETTVMAGMLMAVLLMALSFTRVMAIFIL